MKVSSELKQNIVNHMYYPGFYRLEVFFSVILFYIYYTHIHTHTIILANKVRK